MTATIETVTGAANTMVLNMGPQHPSTHGVLRVVLELDGETVVKAEPVIGYLHTGIEKNMEAKTYSQAITMTDRIDYLAPLSNNLCYCLAVEKILGIEIPKRAQYIRVLLTELTRIASHLTGSTTSLRSQITCAIASQSKRSSASRFPSALNTFACCSPN